jgi:hypothetical protein
LLQKIKAPSAFFCCISRYENKELKRQNSLSGFFLLEKKETFARICPKVSKEEKEKKLQPIKIKILDGKHFFQLFSKKKNFLFFALASSHLFLITNILRISSSNKNAKRIFQKNVFLKNI